ncbi:MAG: hypothetical protein GX173_14620 [Ruminococcaceae bacterium]|nr:hypothetical protein [Oscillospiraceae bacterium]
MKDVDRAYLAGIIDGEGSIMLIRSHVNKFPSPCVSIASASLELFDWTKMVTGIGSIKSKKNYHPERHLASYTYTARYRDVLTILQMISPYLVIEKKKKRAQFILENYEKVTKRNGRYSYNELMAKHAFYNNFKKIG